MEMRLKYGQLHRLTSNTVHYLYVTLPNTGEYGKYGKNQDLLMSGTDVEEWDSGGGCRLMALMVTIWLIIEAQGAEGMGVSFTTRRWYRSRWDLVLGREPSFSHDDAKIFPLPTLRRTNTLMVRFMAKKIDVVHKPAMLHVMTPLATVKGGHGYTRGYLRAYPYPDPQKTVPVYGSGLKPVRVTRGSPNPSSIPAEFPA
ncbi:hypothetical protein B0H14DRAFT_2575796 [Mycena olivaceomarginata]|nr:hypothetical protein B0H14DRAFT_2575796 [Mycena olivaceomarginata]